MQSLAEIFTYERAADTAQTAFLNGAETAMALIRAQPGFLSRTLSQAADGTWCDTCFWVDQAALEAADSALMQSPEFLGFLAMIDRESLRKRVEVVHLMQAA